MQNRRQISINRNYSSLVIDNDKNIVDLFVDVLKDVGIGVTPAYNSTIADRIIPSRKFDLVFIEPSMIMPGGINFFDYYSKRYSHLLGKTVLITGDWRNRDSMEKIAKHGLSMLMKPFDINDVRDLTYRIIMEEYSGTTLPAA